MNFSPTMRFALIALLVASAVGCGDKPAPAPVTPPPQSGKPEPQVGKAEQPANTLAPTDDLRTAKPDVVIKAADLHSEFQKDPAEAMKKYTGKLLEMTGVMVDFETTSSGPLMIFEGPGLPRLLVAGESALSHALPGQTVTLRARCVGGKGVVDCVTVKVEGNPPPTFTAEALSKEVAADGDAIGKKYSNKYSS